MSYVESGYRLDAANDSVHTGACECGRCGRDASSNTPTGRAHSDTALTDESPMAFERAYWPVCGVS